MNDATAVVRNHGDGERRHFFGGGMLTMKLTAAESGGSLMLFEDELVEGKTTPLHIHADEDELLFVLEGRIVVHIGGDEHTVGPAGLAFAPRGVPHAFLVTSATARVLTLQTPGSAEAFYREASEPAVPGSHGTVDFERVNAAAAAVGGMEVMGPPPFARAG